MQRAATTAVRGATIYSVVMLETFSVDFEVSKVGWSVDSEIRICTKRGAPGDVYIDLNTPGV